MCQQQPEILGMVCVFLRSYAFSFFVLFRRVRKIAKKRLIASSCLLVHLSALSNLAPTERIFMKFDPLIIYRKSVEKIQVLLKSVKNEGYSS
jgi:hypothetical protein